MKARLIDIAQEAHVSEATVSRVLAGKGGISAGTQERVLRAARRLGRYSDAAMGAVPLVGVVVPVHDNPIFPAFIDAITSELTTAGADALVGTGARSSEDEARLCDRLVQAGAEGLIVISGMHADSVQSHDHYRDLAARGVRLALVNGEVDRLDAAFITADDAFAVRLAVEHLVNLGHQRIGLAVGDEHTWPVRQKVSGFEALAAELNGQGGAEGPVLTAAFTDFSFAGGFQAAGELIAAGCTGIVCGSDVMALGAVDAAHDQGLRVPEDVSVVGYDDVPMARIVSPSLTTVRQPVPSMARAAVRHALGTEHPSRRRSRSKFTVRPELVARSSTGAISR